MDLPVGAKIGPYQIKELVGSGGMGEVFRAVDERLNREVAIKFIREKALENPQARVRFEHEARSLGKLQHPNLCSVFDIGEYQGLPFMVMELLQGKTLQSKLQQTPRLPVSEVLRLGAEVASALDAAHRMGVIHRDIKPANIYLTRSGAKLLDFGLATQTQESISLGEETVTSPLTAEGRVVGTIPYMAPEQVQGMPADHRTDIFALGHVVYESLTGQRAFSGENNAKLMASILSSSPTTVIAHRPEIGQAVDRIVMRCLEKDPEERWQSARDLAREFQWLASSSGSTPVIATAQSHLPGKTWHWAALLVCVALAGFGIWKLQDSRGRGEGSSPVVLLPIESKEGQPAITAGVAIYPDGSHLMLACRPSIPNASATDQLCSYSFRTGKIEPLTSDSPVTGPGTINKQSDAIAFFSEQQLVRLNLRTGQKDVLLDGKRPLHFPDFNSKGDLLTLSEKGEVIKLPENSRQSQVLFKPEHPIAALQWLPGEEEFVYSTCKLNGCGVYVVSGSPYQATKVLETSSPAVYVDPGYWVFIEGTALFAVPCSPGVYKPTGSRIQLAAQVLNAGRFKFDVAASGLLSYWNQEGNPLSQMLVVDRNGKTIQEVGNPGLYYSPKLSPDGTLLAYGEGQTNTTRDVWVLDLQRGIKRQLTDHPADDAVPTWTPDGQRIAFSSTRSGRREVFGMPVNAMDQPKLLVRPNGSGGTPRSFRPDQGILLFSDGSGSFELALGTDKYRALGSSPLMSSPALSHDGKWLAYELGPEQKRTIFMSRFPVTNEVWQVSNEGASNPSWRNDGQEIFYAQGADIFSAAIGWEGGQPKPQTPIKLFSRDLISAQYRNGFDVSGDGKRFVINKPIGTRVAGPKLSVVVNWMQLLKEKQDTKK